ncbi:LysO family transporter [Limibacter armeniacum]|uniref:LysO family transporter n=1 Tax=Limibacter armeniacum TaxID=466084 RepID=UPI002FE5B791
METLLFLGAGIIIGRLLIGKGIQLGKVEKAIGFVIWGLLFFLGIAVGNNSEVVTNLHLIGGKALVLTLGSVLGSILFSYFVYLKFFR